MQLFYETTITLIIRNYYMKKLRLFYISLLKVQNITKKLTAI